jgi:iron complex outermembrane receptor protein
VSVVSSDQIKRYGYRTLGDILQSLQGFYVSNDRNYAYLGARGVNLGDFNSRILILIDGHRINNNLTDGAFIDTAFLLDVDLIDRIEVIRGPGSVLYGNNAFFGVINVITRKGSKVDGIEASGEYGAFNTYKARETYGKSFDNGLELLLSGTYYDSAGPDHLFYKEYNDPLYNNGVANHMDGDSYQSLFGSLSYKDFTLEGGFINREKINPTAPIFLTFNDSRVRTTDGRGYVDLKYTHELPKGVNVSTKVYYDRSTFKTGYPFGNPVPSVVYREVQTGEWWGAELQLSKKFWEKHIITAGAEYRNDFHQERTLSSDTTTFPTVLADRKSYGVYLQGDIQVCTNLHLNAGARYDKYGDYDPTINPRLALIYNPFPDSTIKLLYGTAFRSPNFLELSNPAFQDVKPEKITSYELVYEQGIGDHLRSSLSGFYNQMDDLIVYSGNFANINAETRGVEAALEGNWANGIQARASYTYQQTKNLTLSSPFTDSPEHMIKLNVSVPLVKEKLFASLEYQYTSSRSTTYIDRSTFATLPGTDAAGYGVFNFTLYSHNLLKNLDISASVYNLLDETYSDPATQNSFANHYQDQIERNGRSFRIQLTYRF